MSDCDFYLHIILLEVTLQEERSKKNDESYIHVCYVTYRIDEQKDLTIKLSLASVKRFNMVRFQEYLKPPRYGITWMPKEAYITYVDPILKLRVYKLKLFSEAMKNREGSPFPGRRGSHGAYSSSHVSFLRGECLLPLSAINGAQHFPGASKNT